MPVCASEQLWDLAIHTGIEVDAHALNDSESAWELVFSDQDFGTLGIYFTSSGHLYYESLAGDHVVVEDETHALAAVVCYREKRFGVSVQ